jgi:hypothetical protein
MRKLLIVLLAVCACQPVAPAPPTPRNAVDVSASFGRTWDALIDQFAARNIPIKTIDRSSGFIATDALKTSLADSSWSDCGKDWMQTVIRPTDATYNAVVRGDSSGSNLRVTVRWVANGVAHIGSQGSFVECSTRGTWEAEFERLVKAAAERRR